MRDSNKPLTAGELRHTVRVTAPAGTVAAGEEVIAVGVPAAINVVPVNFQAREGLQVGGLQTATQYVVTVRYRTDLLPSYVIEEQCCTRRTFQVLNVVPSDRKDALDMTCVVAG